MAVIEDVRPLGAELERSYEVYVRGWLKFRVGRIVYVGFSADERVMGFAFPREEREALVTAEPQTFRLPAPSDLRFSWVLADLPALNSGEARELVVDAWRFVVPKKVSGAYDLRHPEGPGPVSGPVTTALSSTRGLNSSGHPATVIVNQPVDSQSFGEASR